MSVWSQPITPTVHTHCQPTVPPITDATPQAEHRCATPFIDSDHPAIQAFAALHSQGATSDRERAVALTLAVRDGVRYDPYHIDLSPHGMRASTALLQAHGWCVPKAVLLAAVCRAAGIAARLGFADVRNHLSTERMRQTMKTDVFAWHGYTDIWLNGAWRKATPAFNRSLCDRFGLLPLDFDGEHDSLYHPFDRQGQRHMEYLRQRGSFNDLPLADIKATFQDVYGNGLSMGAPLAALSQASFQQDVDAEVAPPLRPSPPDAAAHRLLHTPASPAPVPTASATGPAPPTPPAATPGHQNY
jgi:transglutaminase-like putative cysteine protease